MNKFSNIDVIKASGLVEEFKIEKLENSLRNSGASESDISEVVEDIEGILRPRISTREIYREAYRFLRERHKNTAYNYSLRGAVIDLGPTGYPFEDLVAGVLRTIGYKTEVRLMMSGKCISHEVDVYAYKENSPEAFIVEAKFHNDQGTRSGLQDSLSAKARFDDVSGGDHHNFSGYLPKQMWLVTNTKFSHTALEYGKCAGLKMIGWNYPKVGNLQNLIEENKLHPITALNTLSNSQKQNILKKGVVFCRDLKKNFGLFEEYGIHKTKQKDVYEELEKITGI